jgi:hypothetical protein
MTQPQTPNPLESSYRKLARAEEQFQDLQREVDGFAMDEPYERVTEPHPDKAGYTVDKIRLTKPIPDSIINIAAEMAYNLRTSLDNAGYALAVASGVVDPRHCAFPFAGTIDKMANALGRCKDIPQQIHPLFSGFQPYEGGNDLLWALNEVCNADKHTILQPMGTGVFRASASVRGVGYFCMPEPHVWDSTKNEMKIITLGPGAKYEAQFDFRIFVAFGKIKGIEGKPVVGTLLNMGRIIYRVMAAIEAEARRLKIFK